MENNGGELFIFWLGLKWRLKELKNGGYGSERGVFDCAQLCPFSIQAAELDI